MISIRTHNILDYVVGVALIAAPFLFGFSNVYFARDVFTVVGIALIGYSLLTDYVYSLAKVIPLSMHMTFDVVSGLFLMLAPMIYGYRADLTAFQFAMHFVYGLAALAMVVFTRRGAEPPAIRIEEEAEEARPEARKAA